MVHRPTTTDFTEMEQIPAILSGREVNWCPDGGGHLPYCPSPTDPDNYVYCCSYFYLGDDRPSCCRFPIHTGLLITLILAVVPLICLLVFLYCWCCPSSRLNRDRTYEETRQYD